MESIFKVGDTVRIKDLAKISRETGGLPFGFSPEMQNFSGKEVRIKEAYSDHYVIRDFPHHYCDGYLYHIEGDVRDWSWSNPMFEKVELDILRAGTETPSGTSLPTSDEISRPLKLVTKRYNVKLNFKN